MSRETVLDLKRGDGTTTKKTVPTNTTELFLNERQLVALSANVALLQHMRDLRLIDNAFAEIPAGVLTMTRLVRLNLSGNQLSSVPPEIGCLTALKSLGVRLALSARPPLN